METIKERALAGKRSCGLVVRMWDPLVLEMAKAAGYDFIRLDYEHIRYDNRTLREFFMLARHLDLAVQIRVGCIEDIDEALLAFEPAAICVPGVDTAEMAQMAVDRIKFPPVGKRSMYGGMPSVYYGGISRSEYEKTGNEKIQLIVQLESKEALLNLNEILLVEGVDMVASGKADIAQSLGYSSSEKDHPDVIAAEDMIIEKAAEYGKILTLSVKNQKRLIELETRGVRCFSVGSDEDLLYRAMKDNLDRFAKE